ncbi:MAG: DNA repair protein RadC [Ardenticatenaceae bacterium]|nr:DNA repair protein RadC [Ardenticatenaceae bacterium]
MTKYNSETSPPVRLHDLPASERPQERLHHVGQQGLSAAELLAVVIGTGHGDDNVLHLAQRLLAEMDGLPGIYRASLHELQQIRGIGFVKATRIKASLELGRRLLSISPIERPMIVSPADAVNLVMPEMMFLEQEHLRLILLDTRNRVISTPTIYKGSLNTSVVRVGELFRAALKDNAAAFIAIHNHPSNDPSPSPEDVRLTRQIYEAGQLLSIELMDHIIIGQQRFVSMKERHLGFE